MSNIELPTEPFPTTNRQLAIALISAGCDFAPQTKECLGPASNLYTLGILRQYAMCRGMNIEKAVRALVARKITGIVTFYFLRNEIFFRCIKAWDEMSEEFQNAENGRRSPVLPDYEPEQIMKTMFMGAINGKVMVNEVPWYNTPLVSDISTSTRVIPVDQKANRIPGQEHAPEGKTIIEGKGKIWSLGASRRIKDKLKIK